MRLATEYLPTNMTTMFLNVAINEHVVKEKFFKICAFMTINNEKKLYVVNLTYINWDLIPSTADYFAVIISAVYIK